MASTRRSRRTVPPVLSSVLAVALFGCTDNLPVGLDAPAQQSVADLATSIRDAIRAQERHTPVLMQIRGVVGTGVGLDSDGTPVVRVFTTGPGVADVPGRVDEVPVSVKVTGIIMAGNTTSRARPAPTGYSVGHVNITAGTIGGVVVNGSGDRFILSNNHVLANSNDANIGDPILQPGPFDGGTDPDDQIGALADFEPLDFSGAVNKFDAAIAAVSPEDVDPATPPDGYGIVSSQVFPLDGDEDGAVDGGLLGVGVQKYGRTTMLTEGQVSEINVSASVCYETILQILCTKSAYFEDLLGFPDISDGGDSGSSIVAADGTNRAIGLLFAGSSTTTLASRIDLVLERFGVSYDDGSGNQPPAAAFTYSCVDLDCSFDGSGSTDDGTIVSYDWDFGDGNVATGVTPSHSFAATGTYDVILTVTDDGSLTGAETQSITVSLPGENQTPVSSFAFSCTDLDCSFDGSGSTDDGTIVSYDWDFGDGNVAAGITVNHTYASGGTYSVVLTVTDDGSLTDTNEQDVTVSDPPAGEPTLAGSGTKVKGQHVVELTWSGVPWPDIYVFRGEDGETAIIDTLAGTPTGTYVDETGNKGKATYTYFLCEGTGLLDVCTNPVIISF